MPPKKGYRHSEETKRKISNRLNIVLKRPETKKLISESMKGRVLTDETRRKMSIKAQRKRPWLSGEKNPHWKGGISKRKYPYSFNKKLKLIIRERDNFTCQLCLREESDEIEELGRVLCVNHIDFNKENLSLDNLNTLCLRCNLMINWDRERWTKYFKNK